MSWWIDEQPYAGPDEEPEGQLYRALQEFGISPISVTKGDTISIRGAVPLPSLGSIYTGKKGEPLGLVTSVDESNSTVTISIQANATFT